MKALAAGWLIFFAAATALALQESSTQPATFPATDSTTAPATEPSTIPTSEPATEPATNPATEPSTVPTTQPATQPTTEATTNPTTIPATLPTTTASTQPVDTSTPLTELPDGAQLEDCTGHIQPVGNGKFQFVFQLKDKLRRIELLQNRNLMAMEIAGTHATFHVWGSVTAYGGNNYLLVEKVNRE